VSSIEVSVARSREVERLEEDANQLRVRLSTRGASSDGDVSGDAQASTFARLLGVGVVQTQMVLSVLLVAVIELGASLGLFVALSHGASIGERNNGGRVHPGSVATGRAVSRVAAADRDVSSVEVPNGNVDRFAAENLCASSGRSVGLTMLFRAYTRWCRSNGYRPLTKPEFSDRLIQLASMTGLEVDRSGREPRLCHVSLRAGAGSA
jgi:hypothetical protein